eukprot:Tbor_TRINITY_DN5471_c4_g1::TRINITY_DN5471_c4_g1_i1::g.24202::m.24202
MSMDPKTVISEARSAADGIVKSIHDSLKAVNTGRKINSIIPTTLSSLEASQLILDDIKRDIMMGPANNNNNNINKINYNNINRGVGRDQLEGNCHSIERATENSKKCLDGLNFAFMKAMMRNNNNNNRVA